MNSFLKSASLFVAACFIITSAQAQSKVPAPPPAKGPSQNIIIHKKDSTKEKITVVIDGNKVTVNGKPVEDFDSEDVDIMMHGMNDRDVLVYKKGQVAGASAPRMRAFSSDMARTVKTNSAFLGVMTDETDQGAKITQVTSGSAAEKAGLEEGDIITKLGEDKITGPDDLYKVVGKYKPEDKVMVTYLRNGKQATATATLGKLEQVRVYSWNTPNDFNFNFNENINPHFTFDWNERPRLGISVQDTEDASGVKVLDVDDEDAPAAKAGLQENDIITQVNGKAIASTDALRETMKDLKKGDVVKITYKRNNQVKTVDVKIPKELKTIDL